ncbi:MAG: RNA methyltransferase [Thermoguttaceae bacterium]|jgi:TrmH family RNA methyltransferase
MPIVTSVHNPRVKDAVRLRNRRYRQRERRILIDGVRELARAVAGGVRLREVFVCESLCRSEESRRLVDALPNCGAEVVEVSEAVFEKLAFGQRAEGVLAVADMPQRTLADLKLPARPLLAVLEGVEKPGNVGAVLRSADAAGLSALVVADPRTDLWNPNAIRASLGTIFTMGVCQSTTRDALEWLRQEGLQILAARVHGAVPYTQPDYCRPTAIVLGSEAAGLTPLWSGDDVLAVRLPMLGAADSLNVSAAAAVLFYEARRQRDAAAGQPAGGAAN